jgi:hypothetical protein
MSGGTSTMKTVTGMFFVGSAIGRCSQRSGPISSVPLSTRSPSSDQHPAR